MDSWHIAVLTVSAFLAGAVFLVLIEAFGALRAAKQILRHGGDQMLRTMSEVETLGQRSNKILAQVVDVTPDIKSFLDATGHLARSLEHIVARMGSAAAVGAAVGPALAAVIRTFRPPSDGANGAERVAGMSDRPEGSGSPDQEVRS